MQASAGRFDATTGTDAVSNPVAPTGRIDDYRILD